jgi:2',3'-cyclic-nucleotide 2'-phosphodiesterase (5'-nucleotidase family)
MSIQSLVRELCVVWISLFLLASNLPARQVPITILSTTDLHGNILPSTDYEGNTNRGGIARLATKIAEIRASTTNVLLLDSGDTFQGTAASFLDHGRVIVRLLNHLQFDAWTLGNHEFDWGSDTLAACIAEAKVPVLAGNLKPVSDDAKAKFATVQPFVLKEVDGVKVAIVGLTTPGIPNWSRPRLIPGLEFESNVVALRRIIPRLKDARADVIVLAVHQGIREGGDDHANQLNAVAYGFPEIAVVAGGHTHRDWPEYKFPRTEILYCQASYWGNHLGRIELVYDTEKKKVVRRGSTTILMDESVPLDPKVLELSKPQLDAAEKELARAIGVATKNLTPFGAPRNETPIHNLIFESIAAALGERGVMVDAIVHGLLDSRAMLAEGAIRVGDLWRIVPYENTVGVIEITPAELKEILEENAQSRDRFRGIWGIRMKLKLTGPPGERVVSLADRDGKPLDQAKRYKVAFNSYELASGGTRFVKLREIAERAESKLIEYDFQTREALIRYVEKQKEIRPVMRGWWEHSAPQRSLPKAKPAAPVEEKAEPARVPAGVD